MRNLATLICFLTLATICSPVPAAAQEDDQQSAEPAQQSARRVISLRSLDPSQVSVLFQHGWDVSIVPSQKLRLLAVTGAPDAVEAVAREIERLDNPTQGRAGPIDIEVLAYVVGGLAEGTGDREFPERIGSVINGLRDVFPYTGYALLEIVQTRVAESGRAQVSGQLESLSQSWASAPYQLEIRLDSVSREAIVFSNLDFTARWQHIGQTAGPSWKEVAIETEVGLTPDAPAVIGKSSALGPVGGVFLILRARPAP